MSIPLSDHPRLALLLLGLSDVLLFVRVAPSGEGFALGLTPATLGFVLLGLDVLLGAGLLFRGAWAREMSRYRCWLAAAYLGFVWLVFLMSRASEAGQELGTAVLVAMLRDGLVLVLLAFAFLLLREIPTRSAPAAPPPATSDPGPPSDPS